MDIAHISVSRSKTYDECAQKYKFQYHLKTPSPVEEPFYFHYGKIVHRIAEDYVRGRGERPLGELWDDLRSGKTEVEPGVKALPLPKAYASRMPKHLRAIDNLTAKLGYEGIVEHKFRYDLDPPNDRNVTGFIDRLVIGGNKALIVDYKTTKKGPYRVNRQTVRFDPQLRMYSRVVQREFGIPAENITAALYYLEDGQTVAARYSEASLEGIEREMLDVYRQIEQHDPDQVVGTTGRHCDRCVFTTLCPFSRSPTSNDYLLWDGKLK